MALNTILIAYDITDNTRRARLASMLQVFGLIELERATRWSQL